MHCAALFGLARQPASNILGGLSHQQYREVRWVCIEAVLYTDYQRHFSLVKETQTIYEMNVELFDSSEAMYRASNEAFPTSQVTELFSSADLKEHFHRLLLHFCDISNPMKTHRLCEAWADMILEELFWQGDREKELGIPVQPLNDRDRVNKAYSQVGFIEFAVSPLAFAVAHLMPPLDCLVDNMIENLEHWFDTWVRTSSTPPTTDEKAKVRDRIGKLHAKWPRQLS